MKVLLDTSAFLWWAIGAGDRLSKDARWAIEDPDNDVLVSAASAWEIAIKWQSGRLELPASAERYIPDIIERHGFATLPIATTHALRAGVLPLHHRDPFDRLLVAQGQIEDVPIVTADPAIGRYDVDVLW